MPAPPGNKNALKHGFYSKHFTKGEKQRLSMYSPEDLESEIAALRILADRLLQAVSTLDDTKLLDKENAPAMLALVNTAGRIGTLYRQQKLSVGDDDETYTAIMEAIDEIQAELGLDNI